MLGLNVINYNKPEQLYRNVLNSAVGDWSINRSRLRIRRADDDFEKEFEPIMGRYLDTASITDFLQYNRLDGSKYRDYLYDIPLGVDSDGNGISDGWSYESYSLTTLDNESRNSVQKLGFIDANANDVSSTIYRHTQFTTGTTISAKCTFKTDNAYGRFTLVNYPSYSTIDSKINIESEGEFTTVTLSGTSSGSAVIFYIATRPKNIGDTGALYVQDAILVKNSFIEDIGLLKEDDNSDGVANGFSAETGSNVTATRSVDGVQKIIITNSTGIDLANVITTKVIEVSENDEISISVENKVVGNVKTRISINNYINGSYQSRIDGSVFYNNTDYQTTIENFTIPASVNGIKIKFETISFGAGQIGEGHFKEATLKLNNNSVRISKIFDISKNGNHAYQTAAESQPTLVNEGIFVTDIDLNQLDTLYPTFASAIDDNLLPSGNFENTTGWSSYASNLAVASNTLSATATGSASYFEAYRTSIISASKNRKYLVKARMRTTDIGATIMYLFLAGTNSGYLVSTVATSPVQNQWYDAEYIFTVDATITGNLKFGYRCGFADSATANGKIMELQEAIVLDVTELGDYSMKFDGVDDFLKITDNQGLDITTNINHTILSKITPENQLGYVYSRAGYSAGVLLQYSLYYNPATTGQIHIATLSDNQNASGFNIMSTFNVAVDLNSSYNDFYKNGIFIERDFRTSETYISRPYVRIGCRINNADGTTEATFFKGLISDVTIFAPKRTQPQITLLNNRI